MKVIKWRQRHSFLKHTEHAMILFVYLFEQPPRRWLGREQRRVDGWTSIVASYTGGNKRNILTPRKPFGVVQHNNQYDEEDGWYM